MKRMQLSLIPDSTPPRAAPRPPISARALRWAVPLALAVVAGPLVSSTVAQCTFPLDPGLPYGGITFVNDAKVKAQTFRPTSSGAVCKILHGVRQNGSAPTAFNVWLIQVPPGGMPAVPFPPTSGVLYSASNLTTFHLPGYPVNGSVTPPAGTVILTAGADYALIFQGVGGGGYVPWRGNSSQGAYVNGAGWKRVGNSWQNTTGPADHAFIILGQIPPNDLCNNCTPIGQGTITGTTALATQDGCSSCDTGQAKDVWYCFTPQCDGIVDIDTCGSGYDTVLSVHSPCPTCPGTPNEINIGAECDDCAGSPCGPLASCGSFQANGGQTYRIRVAGFAGDSGPFTLTLNHTPTLSPTGDSCVSAIPISIGAGPFEGTTVLANPSTVGSLVPTPCGSSINSNDVWYKFTPQCSGSVTIDTCAAACLGKLPRFDTVVSVYTDTSSGTCSQLTQVAPWNQTCKDDFNCGTGYPLSSKITFDALGGTEYYARVAGYLLSSGAFSLEVSQTVAVPTNNLCANATTVPSGTHAFNTCGATTSGPPACTVINNDIWYRWVAPCPGQVTVDTCNSTFDTSVAVYSGSCTGTEVACNENASAGQSSCGSSAQSYVTFNANQTGDVFFIRVGAGAAAPSAMGSGLLTISMPHPLACPSPGNQSTSRLFQFSGPVTNDPGAWCLRAPCCFQKENFNVPGANFLMTNLTNNLRDSINAAGCNPDPNNNAVTLVAKAVNAAQGTFKITAYCGSPLPLASPPFEFRVGKGGTQPNSCSALKVVPLAATSPDPVPPDYNPGVYEIPLPGVDCNSNGEDDLIDILDGTSLDANHNGIPDDCDIACIVDANCGDNNACTTDVCNTKAGFCVHTSNVSAGQCCNPANGALTLLDDGEQCTIDTCNVATGTVSHASAPVGAICDDGSQCTYADSCNSQGDCLGLDVDELDCVVDEDCPGGTCNTGAGRCFCDSVCGNGMIEPIEQCDDGNVIDGDGCSSTCILDPLGCPCLTAADCRTPCSDDNACNCATCTAGVCVFTCTKFGNTSCDPGHLVNLDDILEVLQGFSTGFAAAPNADVDPCGGNGLINLDDILKVLVAFSGGNPCGCNQAGTPVLCGSIMP